LGCTARSQSLLHSSVDLQETLQRMNYPNLEVRYYPAEYASLEPQLRDIARRMREAARKHVEKFATDAGWPLDQLAPLRGFSTSWDEPPTDGGWLLKPLTSGGGRGVRFWDAHAQSTPREEEYYFQRYQPGEPYAAIFLAKSGAAELVGISRQLIGTPEAASPWPFGYCGSIGPVDLPGEGMELLQRMATGLVQWTSGLRGLFGIDFIWDGSTPWLVEVNPRYTASCEILELAQRRTLLTEHWRACRPDDDPPPEPLPAKPRYGASPPVLGKLILYARTAVTAPDLSRFLCERSPWSVPFLADVPRMGTQFEPGQPLCTVFASGRDDAECQRKLFRRARRVRRWFGDGE
jgi:predicted ATP-grasp superfamily ATP-dependent carboligase